ncbi:MAG: DUF418 domain-containing protein [Acidobacteria bacterium]|nr:DUF418 domain-containing protein [Acidobacteriota bacterium]
MSASAGSLLTDRVPSIGPVAPSERIEVIDILRGWAIFGILLVNMTHDLPWEYLISRQWTGTADRIVYHMVDIFAKEKFYTLFSFLFGLGFSLQMGRAATRGASFLPVYSRRLLGLYLIGLIQILLVGDGQLRIYALLGFLLLLLRRCSDRIILVLVFLCLLILPVRYAVTSGIRELRLANPQTAREVVREEAQEAVEERQWEQEDTRVHSSGSFGEIIAWHAPRILRPHLSFPWVATWWWLGMEFPLLLLGLYAGRRRIFLNLPAHLPLMRKVMWWGLGLGLLGSFIPHFVDQLRDAALPYPTHQLTLLLWAFGAPALCFFYAAAIVLLAQRDSWRRRLAPLAAVGRLALSNYILHWLVAMFLFYSYGLGLYAKFGPLVGLGLTLLIFPLEVVLSMWWVKRFRFGPAEWLWRTLTYGKFQPMRLQHA